MANTFIVIDCKGRKNILVTHSARKAKDKFRLGFKIEVWNNGILVETIYLRTNSKIRKYVIEESQYIGKKQALAEQRNKRRKNNGL